MCVLATDQKLVDMERFCTGYVSSVLSVDQIFNLDTHCYSNTYMYTYLKEHDIVEF